MKPFLLQPAYKDYLWGGERLRGEFGKETELTPLAESWELSCHPAGPSVVNSGEQAGRTLLELLDETDGDGRRRLLGRGCDGFERFPVLIKLIDAAKPLSIQVHPSDEYALKNENSYGKTEMWYVLDAGPDSFIYYGFQRPVTREEFRAAIGDGTLTDLLARRPVRAGDLVLIPAGTVHAIGENILVAEVQQNSDLTYRVYDFGRLGPDGQPRPLHVDKAVEVANLTPMEGTFSVTGRRVSHGGVWTTMLASCPYFSSELLEVDGVFRHIVRGESFLHYLCIDGEGEVGAYGERLALRKGTSVFVPADAGEYTVSGRCRCLVTGAGGQE